MKRSLMSLLLALALVSLYMPAFADDSSSDSMEDMNLAIGALTAKVDALAKKGPSVSYTHLWASIIWKLSATLSWPIF